MKIDGTTLTRLGAEFMVIVVGVLVALGAESAWQERQDRADETELLIRIRDDLRADGEYVRAFILHAAGRTAEARDLAAGFVDEWRRERVEETADTWWYHEWGAQAGALSGDLDLARAEAELALAATPPSEDAVTGPRLLRSMAQVYAVAGDHDRALELLEELRRHPSEFSDAELVLDPAWDSIRDAPRFAALLGR